MRSEFVYTSEDPKIGEPPSFSWEHFATPKLRRLPQSSFTFVEYVGHGAEGIVVKVKADGYPEPIVFKIVSPDSPYCHILIACDHDNRCRNVVLIMNSSYKGSSARIMGLIGITSHSRENASTAPFLS